MASPAFVLGTALKQERLLGSVGLSIARESRYGVGASLRHGVFGSLDPATGVGRGRASAFEAFSATKVQDAWPKLGMASSSKAVAAALTGLTTSVTAQGRPGKLEIGGPTKQLRAEIGDLNPWVKGGVTDPAGFGLFDGRKDIKGLNGVAPRAADLFAGMDSRGAVKMIGADLASFASLTAAAGTAAHIADLGAGRPTVDLGLKLGLNSAATGLLGRADVSSIAKQMRAEIRSLNPWIMGGVKQDPARFGLLSGLKDAGGVFNLHAGASKLFSNNNIASIAKQTALGDPSLLEALTRAAFGSYAVPAEEAGSARRGSIDAFVLQWLRNLQLRVGGSCFWLLSGSWAPSKASLKPNPWTWLIRPGCTSIPLLR